MVSCGRIEITVYIILDPHVYYMFYTPAFSTTLLWCTMFPRPWLVEAIFLFATICTKASFTGPLQQVIASLSARDHKVKPICGDGDCLFHALAFVLYGTEMCHEKVHELLVQFHRTEIP